MADEPTAQQEEIELNFRLDEEGRTAPTKTRTSTEAASKNPPPTLDYRSQTVQTTFCYCNDDGGDKPLDTEAEQALLDELLLDCEMADSGLMPRTFWMPAHGKDAQCTLEQFALDIFRHHVPQDAVYDPDTSGAEWWVQIRPSPPAGRYAMHAKADLDDEISRQGIWFHWDKDEDLRQLMGGDTTYIHPHLSTVTYLTPHGAPTLAINRRIHPLTGEWIEPTEGDNDQAFLSWPGKGKHLSFDGRFLHAAPPDLLPEDARLSASTTLSAATSKDMTPDQRKQVRRQRRVTFLVNIWLNYKPFNVHPFPMLDKMSGTQPSQRGHLRFGHRSVLAEEFQETPDWGPFQWPMGGCDSGETISLTLSLEQVRRNHKHGGNVNITWPVAGVRLAKNNTGKKRRIGENPGMHETTKEQP
eukprot:scaffold1189_cov194-Amphora_coffeaeformis.AAC.11